MPNNIEKIENSQRYEFEVYRQTAKAMGSVYNRLLDHYLSTDNKSRADSINSFLLSSPPSLRGLYKKGVTVLQNQLTENHNMVKGNEGQEAQYLMGIIVDQSKKTDEEKQNIKSQLTPDRIMATEHEPGVYTLQADRGLYNYLVDEEITIPSAACVYLGHGENQPSFMLLKVLSLDKKELEKEIPFMEDKQVRHEFHHLVWHFLKRGNIIPKANEPAPEMNKAFEHFRDEMVAYIIQDKRFDDINYYDLTYSDNEDVKKVAAETKSFAEICFALNEHSGEDRHAFIYPAMTSRNFPEFKEKTARLVSVPQVPDETAVKALADAFRLNKSEAMCKLIRIKKISVQQQTLNNAVEISLSTPNKSEFMGYSIHQFFEFAEYWKKFGETVNLPDIPVADIAMQALSQRTNLPAETIKALSKYPSEYFMFVHADYSGPEDFIENVFSPSNLRDRQFRHLYKDILNSSPAMRQSFDSMKDKIAEDYIKFFKIEWKGEYDKADEKGKRKLDRDVERRIRMMKNL